MIARDFGLLLILGAVLPALWFETVGWRDLPDAPQTVYQADVPQPSHGTPFFMIGLYHALSGEHHGDTYDLDDVRAAGFNTVHFWEGQRLADVADAALAAGLRVVYHAPDDSEVRRFREHPALLSWYLDEEPMLRFDAGRQAELRETFAARRQALRQIDPERPVHIVAGPPGDFDAWDRWMRVGDVAMFSVYPARSSGRFALAGLREIADSVSRAVRLEDGSKPVWFVAQAFASPRHGFRLPTAREYRAMVYTAIVHGATGIMTFAFDSFVTRDGQVLGIAPASRADYGDVPDYDGRGDRPLVADPDELSESRALWRDVADVNRELAALTPALLSPTPTTPYRVSVRGLSEVATPVRTLLKRDGADYVLIAVNVADRALDVRFEFDVPVDNVRRQIAEESPAASADGWTDRFAAFGARIYRFSLTAPADAGSPDS